MALGPLNQGSGSVLGGFRVNRITGDVVSPGIQLCLVQAVCASDLVAQVDIRSLDTDTNGKPAIGAIPEPDLDGSSSWQVDR